MDNFKSLKQGAIDAKTSPFPYYISIPKLIVLSIATFGFFDVYWFYKQFKSYREVRRWDVNPWLRAFFFKLTAYTLFREVKRAEKGIDSSNYLFSFGLAVAFFVITLLYKLPSPYWLLSLLTFAPLIPVQNSINFYWDSAHGDNVARSKFGGWNYPVAIVGLVVVGLTVFDVFAA